MPENKEIEQLKRRVEELETVLYSFISPSQMVFNKNIDIPPTTGVRIGRTTAQKIGFYGVTPISQRSGSAQGAVATTGAVDNVIWGYSTAAQANGIVTLVNELRAWAVAQGFIKGSA